MADEVKDSSFDLETSIDDIQVTVLYPDSGSTSGFKNARIAIADFFLALWTQINTNTANLAAYLLRIVALEDSFFKTYNAATGTFTKTQASDSILAEVCFTTITGTPTISIGTTEGGTDLLSSRDVEDGFKIATINKHTTTSRTLYFTITGGTCDVVTFSRLNLNS